MLIGGGPVQVLRLLGDQRYATLLSWLNSDGLSIRLHQPPLLDQDIPYNAPVGPKIPAYLVVDKSGILQPWSAVGTYPRPGGAPPSSSACSLN